MAKKTDEERLAELEAKRAHLDSQMQRIRSQQKERQRKEDTRRKVLVGAAVLAEADRNPDAKARLMGLLDRYLERPNDRAVFDLPPRVETGKKPEQV